MALVIDFTAQDIRIGLWAHLLWARRFGPGAECMYKAVKIAFISFQYSYQQYFEWKS